MASAYGLSTMMNTNFRAFENKEKKSLKAMRMEPLATEGKWNNPATLCEKRGNFTYMGVAMEERMTPMVKNPNPVLKTSFDMVNIGRMVKGGRVYRQNLTIRSFDIGFDGNISLTALMSYLQDTALNHGTMMGVLAEGEDLGITKEMCRNDLIWVISSLQVELYQYPSWLDVVEVETWMYPSGQNGLGHDWIIRDTVTGHTIARATSVQVLMNKKTRKLSKMLKEIREEVAPHVIHCSPILDKDTNKFPKLDIHSTDFIRTGLRAGWNDLDVNQHVNNTKYINWILESVPRSLMKHHQLSSVSLKFRRECNVDDELNSLSKIVTNSEFASNRNQTVEMEHLLRLENGPEIVGGRTIWKPRSPNSFGTNCIDA